jgi:hypothetical protein
MRSEYKLLHFKVGLWSSSGLPDDLNMKFDELGREGWEYVDMKPIQSGGLFLFFIGVFTNTKQFLAVFRRPIQ